MLLCSIFALTAKKSGFEVRTVIDNFSQIVVLIWPFFTMQLLFTHIRSHFLSWFHQQGWSAYVECVSLYHMAKYEVCVLLRNWLLEASIKGISLYIRNIFCKTGCKYEIYSILEYQLAISPLGKSPNFILLVFKGTGANVSHLRG